MLCHPLPPLATANSQAIRARVPCKIDRKQKLIIGIELKAEAEAEAEAASSNLLEKCQQFLHKVPQTIDKSHRCPALTQVRSAKFNATMCKGESEQGEERKRERARERSEKDTSANIYNAISH